jgi:hypothetical protein
MNSAITSCKTEFLSDSSKLYWQFTCEKIWLTLETPRGKKFIIDSVPVDLYGYKYRLGFSLIKEFETTILFRDGCPANGPCIYTLIDKATGKKVKEFDQLICIDTDVFNEPPHKYEFDFVVYFSDQADSLVIYYIDTKKTLKVPFNDRISALIPSYQFDNMIVENNILTLYYESDDNKQKSLKIDLDAQRYSR